MSSNTNRIKCSKQKKNQSRGPRARNITSRQVKGFKYSPSLNPPDVTAQPWYPVTLSWLTKPGTVTFDTVVTAFRKQLDPNSTGLNQQPNNSNSKNSFRVQFRFTRVAVWNLSGRAISLTVWDDLEQNNSDKDQLGGWTDCGGVSSFPCIGYQYPLSHANRVHRPDETLHDTVVFSTTASSNGDNLLCHLHCLWRFDGSVKVIAEIRSPEQELLEALVALTAEIKASQPSTADRVLDGVKTVAQVVTVASAGYADHVGITDAIRDLNLSLHHDDRASSSNSSMCHISDA